jgi:hypothetical protein
VASSFSIPLLFVLVNIAGMNLLPPLIIGFSSCGNFPDTGGFRQIVIGGYKRMVKIGKQVLPFVERVTDGFAEKAFGCYLQ